MTATPTPPHITLAGRALAPAALIMGETTAMPETTPATRPMPALTARQLTAALAGGGPDERAEAPGVSSTDPYLATDEPTIAEAARLLQRILASGAVARLDLLHDALRIAHRRGRAAERSEVQRIATEHAAAFVGAVTARTDAEFRDDAQSWCER
jgi:hypothetical protein